MQKKLRLIICGIYTLSVLTANASEVQSKLPDGRIESPYEACKEVIIVDKDKYETNVRNHESWKAVEARCHLKVQLADDFGFTSLSSLEEAPKYLNFATKVATKVISNLDKSRQYAICSASCFSNSPSCSAETSGEGKAVNCTDRRNEVLKSINNQSRQIRTSLALARGDESDLLAVNKTNILSLDDDKRFNKSLHDCESGTPNPIGRNSMTPAEIEYAKRVIKSEKDQVEKAYKAMLVEKNAKDTPDLASIWKAKALMEIVDKRQEENQLKYRQLIYEDAPIFAVIERPTTFQGGDLPVWSDKQIAEAFKKLISNAESTKKIVQDSIDKGKLEFSRTKGEALGLWLKDLVPGAKSSNDLLYYMGMKNQVEEILKEDKSMCASATSMAKRLESKDYQNNAVVFVGSFAGGAITKGASRGAVAVFKIGRALSGSEAAGITGLAIGSAYLGDSFKQYNTAVKEVTSGVRSASELQEKRVYVGMNLVFAPFMGPSGWALGKTLYTALGKKMAKDVPEIASLMKKAGTSQSSKDQVVDKWINAKLKAGIKQKLLDNEDASLLKSEVGAKTMESLAADITKNNPEFFKDPNNFDYFLKTAATIIKKREGDPADLGEKAKTLFLSFNTEAFQNWDPKARENLMKIYSEGVEELRSAYSKDPAAYAKFSSDQASQEKIMYSALKRAGVDDADAQAMKTCSLRK